MESQGIMTMAENSAGMLENVLVNGDLSKLTPGQRLQYYKQVCQSIGLNPLSKPFDYIILNGKLTLYARKDAADQLRKINGVSIDRTEIDKDGDFICVTAYGHDKTGRADVELGVVSKKDMRGDFANAMMKAMTKAKRRLTLSLCGLGWLDETEVETIPDAKPVVVADNGEIVEASAKPAFDEEAFLQSWSKPANIHEMSRDNAEAMTDSEGKAYGAKSTRDLYFMMSTIQKKLGTLAEDQKPVYEQKLSAICEILQNRKLELTIRQ